MALESLPAATASEPSTAPTVADALLALSSHDQDHALHPNGVGFSGTDTQFGNSLADQIRSSRPLSYRQAHSAWVMLKKYRRQLADNHAIDYYAIAEPDPKDFEPTAIAEIKAQARILDVGHSGELVWTFPFSREIYLAIKGLKGSHWDNVASQGFSKSVWRLNFHAEQAEQIFQVAEASDFTLTDGAKALIGKVGADAKAAMAAATAESAEPIPELLETLKLTPYPYQWAAVHYAVAQDLRVFIGDDVGLGKLLPDSEPVLTPTGWIPMGQLKIGDRAIGVDGKPTKIVGVYPQGKQPIVRVTFSDGTWTRASWDHLWTVQVVGNDSARRYPDRFDGNLPEGRWRTMTTRQIVDAGLHNSNGGHIWRIPLVAPVQFDPVELPMDPYTLGVLLGNGHLGPDGSVSVTGDTTVSESLALAGRYKEHDSPGISAFHVHDAAIRHQVARFGLRGKRSPDKFVPEPYLRGSIQQRLALLQGLMDTDGYPMPDGGAEFSSTSRNLMDAVVELVQSLGGIARGRRDAAATFTYKGERRQGRPAERVNIKLPAPLNPFRARKAASYIIPTKYPPTRTIESVVEDGFEDATCIRVDSPDHLYVTRSYIVTHNSLQAEMIAEYIDILRKQESPGDSSVGAFPILIICPNSVKPKWAHEIHKAFPHRQAYVINGSDPLPGLLKVDYYIANWESLSDGWDKTVIGSGKVVVWKLPIRQVVNRGVRGLIIDESQCVRNPGAQRTVACEQLSDAVVHECERRNIKPLLLNLTGTPVMNRPRELATQLRMIRRLDDFGGYWQFVSRYNKYTTSLSGSEIPDTGPLKELHDRLLMTCMIRRTKTQVNKDLPPLLPNAEMPMAISNRAEYQRAAADAARWFAEAAANDEMFLQSIQGLPEDEHAAAIKLRMTSQYIRTRRGEVLARISALKTVAERGRRAEAISWIEEFLQETGKKLVVFSVSREAQNAMVKHFHNFNPALLLGGMQNELRYQENQRFLNDPTCRLAICSLKAANAGIDLFSASDVYHHELGWNPGTHHQATGRTRPQTHMQPEAVTPWFAYGEDTIEADIYDLIWNQKATIVDAIHDGTDASEKLQTGSILGDLIERLTHGRVKRTVMNGGVSVTEVSKTRLAGDVEEVDAFDPFASDVLEGEFEEIAGDLPALPPPAEARTEPVQEELFDFDLFEDTPSVDTTIEQPMVIIPETAAPTISDPVVASDDLEFEILLEQEDEFAF